jgi:2-polyprenyl-3-methyl-5-hydroxy-6-metoxy-1,4-benzoquinol methylase
MTNLLRGIAGFIYLTIICWTCKSDQPKEPESQVMTNPAASASAVIDTPQTQELPTELLSSPRVAWQKPRQILSRFGTDLKNKVIADIGAGPTGFFTFYLAQQGATVIAIDIDPGALSYIEKEKSLLDSNASQLIKTRLARPMDPKLSAQEVDGILIVNTISYIKNRRQYLRLLLNKLKPGGRIVIVDFKMKRLPDQVAPPKSQRVYADELEEDLYAAGYRAIQVDDQSLEYQYILLADK